MSNHKSTNYDMEWKEFSTLFTLHSLRFDRFDSSSVSTISMDSIGTWKRMREHKNGISNWPNSMWMVLMEIGNRKVFAGSIPKWFRKYKFRFWKMINIHGVTIRVTNYYDLMIVGWRLKHLSRIFSKYRPKSWFWPDFLINKLNRKDCHQFGP